MSELVSGLFVQWFTLVLVNKFFSLDFRHTWHHSQSLGKDILAAIANESFSCHVVLFCLVFTLVLAFVCHLLIYCPLFVVYTQLLRCLCKISSNLCRLLLKEESPFLSWTEWMRADSRHRFVFGSLALDTLKTFNSNYFRCVRFTSLLPGKKNIISIHQQILFS